MSELQPEGIHVAKVFTPAGPGWMVPPAVATLLGLQGPAGLAAAPRQAIVLVVATSKSAAAELLRSASMAAPPLSTAAFPVACGRAVNALRAAGWLRDGWVFCLRRPGGLGPVVAIRSGQMRIVGSLESHGGPFTMRFQSWEGDGDGGSGAGLR